MNTGVILAWILIPIYLVFLVIYLRLEVYDDGKTSLEHFVEFCKADPGVFVNPPVLGTFHPPQIPAQDGPSPLDQL